MMSALNPKRPSNTRTKNRPVSEATGTYANSKKEIWE